MANWHPIQDSFSGGEVSPRVLSRQDAEFYRSSVLEMFNFIPTLQGPAERAPGSRFIQDIDDLQGVRIFPYLSIINEPSLIQMLDETVKIYQNIANSNGQVNTPGVGGNYVGANQASGFKQQVISNPDFAANSAGWVLEPDNWSFDGNSFEGCRWTSALGGGLDVASWAITILGEAFNFSSRFYQPFVVSEPSDRITLDARVLYREHLGAAGLDNNHDVILTIGTAVGVGNVATINLSQLALGSYYERITHYDLPAPGYTGTLYITFSNTQKYPGKASSSSSFVVDYLRCFTDAPDIVGDIDLISPFLESELDAVHFVQSPYGNKEMVMVHPNHPPQWMYYDPNTTDFVLEPIPFTNPPTAWTVGNYPSTCTAYQGRLILAATPNEGETVWGTEPGNWKEFTLAPSAAGDSIEFTAIFRSNIQWIQGHKDLLIGATNQEYVARAQSGLLQPGDIDCRLHSTHGGVHVQPAGFGEYVLFAAERGSKVRAERLNRDDEGWVAPDLTLMAEHITRSGVRRMARLRNPHQICVCLLNNGTMAMLHMDSNAEIAGWSRYDVGGVVDDIAVIANDQGLDILYMVVRRTIEGVTRLHLEAVVNFAQDLDWDYVFGGASLLFDEEKSVLTGLEHLEGLRCQVVGDRSYLGTYLVENGQITLTRPEGGLYSVSAAVVGRQEYSRLVTLPAITTEATGGLASKKRYSTVGVRCINSTRPIINGQRPADRDPATPMDISQAPDIVRDNEVVSLGTNNVAIVTIEENTPVACEISGLFGKLTSTNL